MGTLWPDPPAEPPEHRACRINDERVAARMRRYTGPWRLGNRNPNNVYVGETHAGLLLDPELAAEIVRVMNEDLDRRSGTSKRLGEATLEDTVSRSPTL